MKANLVKHLCLAVVLWTRIRTEILNPLLASIIMSDSLKTAIELLKTERQDLKKQVGVLAKKLKGAQRRRSKVMQTAKKLSKENLQFLLDLDPAGSGSGSGSGSAPEPVEPTSGAEPEPASG